MQKISARPNSGMCIMIAAIAGATALHCRLDAARVPV